METYPDIALWLSITFVLGGFALLAWSANAFVDGASALAKAFGVSPFVIGICPLAVPCQHVDPVHVHSMLDHT